MNVDRVFANCNTAHFSARPYDYYHPHDHASWESQYIDNGPLSAGNSTPEDPSKSHWRSPLTPAFPPHFSGPPTSSSGRESGGSFTAFAPTNGLGFPMPMPARSMSVHGGQDFHRNYQNQFTSAYDSDTRRRASERFDTHPPSLQASHHSSTNSVSEPSGTPLLSSGVTKQWGIPPMWNHQGQIKPPDFGWYSPEPGGLPQVQEEDVPPPFGSPPAAMYPDGVHH